jgi:predicted DsbA family dithiol-disulfide isomerase
MKLELTNANTISLFYINFVDVDNKLNAAYGGMQYVPTTLIINKNGEIKEVIQGARPYESFMESIKKVL